MSSPSGIPVSSPSLPWNYSKQSTPDSTVGIGFKAPVVKGDVGREGSCTWLPKNPSTFSGTQFGRSRHAKSERDGMFTLYIHLEVKDGESKKDETSSLSDMECLKMNDLNMSWKWVHTSRKLIHFRCPNFETHPYQCIYNYQTPQAPHLLVRVHPLL